MDASLSPFPRTADRWQRWFLVGLFLLFVGVGVQYTFKVGGANDHRSAFLRWRQCILQVSDTVNIYEKHTYPNPPIMALMLWPLEEMPPLAGSLLWFWLKAGLALLVFHWVFGLVEEPGRPFPVWAKMLAVALSLRPIIGDLSHGNINIFILFLVVGALVAFRHRRDALGGLVLGLAIACKVTPILFVPYFLWKRGWGLLAGCAAGLALSLWVVPGLFLGFGHNQEMLEEWAQHMITPFVVQGKVTTEHQNQSLPGLVHRLTTHGPSFSNWDADIHGYVPAEYHNVLDLDPAIPQLIVKLCMLAFAGLVFWRCRTLTRERDNWRLAAEYALIILGMLIFSERTWKHHCVALVPPFTLLVYCLSDPGLGAARRKYLIGTLATAVILISATSSGLFGADTDGLAKMTQVYGAYLWANLMLAAAVIVLLKKSKAVPNTALQSRHLRERVEIPTVTATGMPVRA